MKTKFYYLVTSALLLGCVNTKAKEGNPFTYESLTQKTRHIMEGDTNKKSNGRYQTEELTYRPSTAEGRAYGRPIIEDIRIYNVSGRKSMAVSYVPGRAAAEVGYMGFKVGDQVKWQNPAENLKNSGNKKSQTDFTGIIDLLDSDKCYIKIDHCNKFAVKPYEDILKINP